MPAFLELATDTAQETRAVGKAIAEVLGSGDVISLTGDLGAGKTTLVQGMAKGLEKALHGPNTIRGRLPTQEGVQTHHRAKEGHRAMTTGTLVVACLAAMAAL